jgi:hypothetical protein
MKIPIAIPDLFISLSDEIADKGSLSACCFYFQGIEASDEAVILKINI